MLLAPGKDNKLSLRTTSLRVAVCWGDAPPRSLGCPRLPSGIRELAPPLRSHSLFPGLLAVAEREVPEGRGLQTRDVPSGGRGR